MVVVAFAIGVFLCAAPVYANPIANATPNPKANPTATATSNARSTSTPPPTPPPTSNARSTSTPTPTTIAEIAFEGVDSAGLRAYVGIEEGAALDPRAVRDALRALHGSARFSRVAAYVEPLAKEALRPGWAEAVRLVFVLSPVQKLAAVSFLGQRTFSEGFLAQTAGLQVNAEYQADQLARATEAVRAAYYRAGYRRARVDAVERPVAGGVALELFIEEGTPTRIAEVRFTGELGLEERDLSPAFRLRAGDVLRLAAADEGVRLLRERYRRAGRLRARVEPPIVEELSDGSARVTVPVRAGPLVRFRIRGNRAFPESLLAQHLGHEADEPLDAQAAQEMAARLRRFYVGVGFLRARVAEREVETKDGEVEIVFTVDEDPESTRLGRSPRPVRVEQIRFAGNRTLSREQLRERVLLVLNEAIASDPASGADAAMVDRTGVAGTPRVRSVPRTTVDPATVFDPVLYARALKQIEDKYKSEGFLSVRVGPPRPEALSGDSYRLAIAIPVAEGPRTTVSRITIEGGGEVPAAELNRVVALRPGAPFSYLAAEEGRAALTQIFTRRGHLYARVEDEEIFEEAEEGEAAFSRVEVHYRVQPGPVVRVGFVEVIGQRRTEEALVRDLVELRPGDVLTPEVLDRGQQALLRTGLFFSATLTPRNPEVPEGKKTVQVLLRERPTKDLQASVGFSLADGPRTTVQWTQGNLLGRNFSFAAVAKADFPFTRYTVRTCPPNVSDASQCTDRFSPPSDPIERVVDLGFLAPRLYPLTDKLRGGIDLIHERALRLSYKLTKYSSQVSLDLVRRRPFGAGVQYELGYQALSVGQQQSIEDVLAGIDKRIFRLPPGEMVFGSLRPSVTLDLRDDPARPRSGLFAQFSGDFLRSLAVSKIAVGLLKLQGLVAGYVPLPLLSSLVLSARAGRITQLQAGSKTPGDRRFYLGGATSLRGFHEDAVQPQDLIDQLHREVENCQNTLTGASCTREALLLQAGATSNGGDQFVAFGAELRVPFAQAFEAAFFYDAGNLWLTPRSFTDKLVLRDAIGFGLRWLTPIGRLAIDLGINLQPDALLGEPRLGPYFSLDPL